MTPDHPERLSKLPSLTEALDKSGERDAIMLGAMKRGLALKLAQAMKEQALTKTAMAQRMGTSRAQLDRVLDPTSTNVTLDTISRAARSLGKQVQLELV